MLTKEKNELLCFVEGKTTGNELFRSLWLPAILSSQLPMNAKTPVRLKLLGEELLAFRDGNGEVGIVQAHCLHRGAPLYFGKIEAEGIRCAYHGWLYRKDGQCLEMPSESNTRICERMKLKAYQVVEKADIVWIYMGSGVAPELPKFPWMDLPAEQRLVTVWLQESNWVQGAEGEIDSSHVSTLHKSEQGIKSDRVHRSYTFSDPMPKLTIEETSAGFMSIARRNTDSPEKKYWRITQWVAPMFSAIPSAAWPIGGRAWIPIDNENTYCWDFSYVTDGALPELFYDYVEKGVSFPPEYSYQPHELNTGSIIDTWIPLRRRSNDYLVNREIQGENRTTGIHGVNDQDRAMQEGMGRILDRSKERLVSADLSIMVARKKILSFLESAEGLSKFKELVRDGSVFNINPIDAVSEEEDVNKFLISLGLKQSHEVSNER